MENPSAPQNGTDAVAEVSCPRDEGTPDQQQNQQQTPPESPAVKVEVGLSPGSLASQLCPLGPKDRCTPSQAQAMGQQVLALLAMHEKNNLALPIELQNTFDVFHRCLAVAYSTFFLNLYTKANAPCLLCHGCQSLYPPGQYIHHACPALPPNIVPCRSRMWRRCLVPLLSSNLDKVQQKQRWKYVLEKFSHSSTGVVRRNPLPPEAESQLLEIPECKRGRFVRYPANKVSQAEEDDLEVESELVSGEQRPSSLKTLVNGTSPSLTCGVILDMDSPEMDTPPASTVNQSHVGDKSVHTRTSSSSSSRALDLVGELVQEIRQLEHELAVTRSKLQAAEGQLRSKQIDDGVREKLASALMMQQVLVAERDHALQQSRLSQQRAESLQQQLDSLHTLHTAMEAQFSQRGSSKV